MKGRGVFISFFLARPGLGFDLHGKPVITAKWVSGKNFPTPPKNKYGNFADMIYILELPLVVNAVLN
jgi:hypothetical protein